MTEMLRKTVDIYLILILAAFIFAFAVNAEDVVNDNGSIDTDTVSIQSDGGNDVNAIDTVNTVNNVDTNVDTINAVNTVNNDSSKINKRPSPIKPITEPLKLSGAYWGLGLGLSVGTVPIFPMWQKYFPDSLRINFSNDDTTSLRNSVIESPDAFNFTVPLCLSLYSIGDKQVFSFTVSFFRNSKEFQSELSEAVNVLERLIYYSVSIEAADRWEIPPIFFSIDGTQRTLLTLALGASRINFVRESEINKLSDRDDGRTQTIFNTAKKTFATLSGNGLSLSWRVGISAIKRYQSGYGAEFGIFYSGAYSNYFYSDGVRLTEDHIKVRGADLTSENVVNGKPLSFISNQAEFRVTLLVPTRKGGNNPVILND